MHVLPARSQRQAHENTLDPCTRLAQSKGCASVVQQVELNVSSPAKLLPCLFRLCVWHVFALLNDGDVAGEEGLQTCLNVSEGVLLIALGVVKVIEEDTADTTSLVAVGVDEVLITPLFESWVILLVVCVTGLFQGLVEVDGVLIEERSEERRVGKEWRAGLVGLGS